MVCNKRNNELNQLKINIMARERIKSKRNKEFTTQNHNKDFVQVLHEPKSIKRVHTLTFKDRNRKII